MHPKCVITINGAPVSGLFWEKLLRVTVHDKEGTRSDSIDIELEDGPPHIAIPAEDDIIRCWLGYEDGPFDYMGAYTVDDVDVHCLPWRMSIKGKSADMREELKQHKERHWDNTPLRDVVAEIASEVGLTPQVDPEIGAFVYPWLAQQNESALHFLERIADRHDGLFTVKDGKLIIAKRGAGITAGGTALPPLVIRPEMILQGTCSVSFGQRERHKDVRAEYYDFNTAKRERVGEESDPRAKPRYTLRHPYMNKDEARRAARSRAKYLRQAGIRTTVSIEGNPGAKAGRPMVYENVRPGVDGIPFLIEDAEHSFSKSQGYRTEIKAKLASDAPASSAGRGSRFAWPGAGDDGLGPAGPELTPLA